MSIEQVVLEKFRALSAEKQQEVLDFVELLQQGKIEPPTKDELAKADEIIACGLTRAKNAPSSRPTELIWDEFEAIRAKIAAKVSDSESTIETNA